MDHLCNLYVKLYAINMFDINFFWQKIALDKLLIRLHRMYEAIGQATQATIDPILKDTKIETVMGKLECEFPNLFTIEMCIKQC